MGLPPPLTERKGKIDGLFLGLGVYARARASVCVCVRVFVCSSSFLHACGAV